MNETPPSEPQVMLTHLDWNLQRLDEVLKQEQSDYFKGAALQRFGHTYDIALKTIQTFAQSKSIPCKLNEQCLETAVQNGWMENNPDWKEIVADYQLINQKPKQDTDNVYSKLATYHKAFHHLFDQLKKVA
ncbi:MAG: nucleotidyltransferase substrate binding protein [Nitrospinota bacterium]